MSVNKKIIWLFTIAIWVRLVYALSFPPRSFPDTQGYFQTGQQILNRSFCEYSGKRPPVYPLLTALTGYSPKILVFIQASMGVFISFLIYLIFSNLTKNDNYGFILGLSYALNPSQVLFEFGLVSETTCTFFLILTIFFLLFLMNPQKQPKMIFLILIGLISSLCILTRAQFLPLPILILFFLVYHFKYSLGEKLFKLIYFIVPVAILIGSWSWFQYRRIGQFVVSPDIGLSLTSHTIGFIESAPQSFDIIKHILIQNREHYLKTKGTMFNSVAASIPELLKTTGYSYPELCSKLKEMNLFLIKKEPVRYLRSVTISIVQFFKPTWYGHLFGIRPAVTKGGWLLRIIAATYAVFHIFMMVVFLFFPLLSIIIKKLRGIMIWILPTFFIYTLTLLIGISAAFIERGENARYKTSVEPLMICMAIWAAFELIRRPSQSGKR